MEYNFSQFRDKQEFFRLRCRERYSLFSEEPVSRHRVIKLYGLPVTVPQEGQCDRTVGSGREGRFLRWGWWVLEALEEGPCLQDKLRILDSILSIMCVWRGMGKGHSQIWILESVVFKHSRGSKVCRQKAGGQMRKLVITQVRENDLFTVATTGLSTIPVVNRVQ